MNAWGAAAATSQCLSTSVPLAAACLSPAQCGSRSLQPATLQRASSRPDLSAPAPKRVQGPQVAAGGRPMLGRQPADAVLLLLAAGGLAAGHPLLRATPACTDIPCHAVAVLCSMASPSHIIALVETLQNSSGSEQRRAAAAALADLAAESPENRSAASAAGEELMQESVRALGNTAVGSPEIKAAAIAAGTAPLLVQLLTDGQSSSLHIVVAGTIHNLTADHTAAALVSAGAATALVGLMGSGCCSTCSSINWVGDKTGQMDVQSMAARAVAALADNSTRHTALLAAGAVPAAAEALTSSNPKLQLAAVRLLKGLASEEGAAAIVASEAAMRRLVQLLGSPSLQTTVAEALANLTTLATTAAAVVAAGGVHALLGLLRRSTGPQAAADAERAVGALANLACSHAVAAADVAAAGGIPLILSMLMRQDDSASGSAAAGFLQNVAANQPHLIDASIAGAATAGLISFSAHRLEDEKQLSMAGNAVANVWQSSEANRHIVESGLARLQHSSNSRVQQAAGLLAAVLPRTEGCTAHTRQAGRDCLLLP